MASNPFDPKRPPGLLGLDACWPPVDDPFAGLWGPPPPAIPLDDPFEGSFGTSPPPPRTLADFLLGDVPKQRTLADLPTEASTQRMLADILRYLPPPSQTARPKTKRMAFFSFHYDDVMRVNAVRNAWKITHPDSPMMRSFYDSSLWERRKLEGDEAVKRLIRTGVYRTSAVCVLAGADTWWRRWVRYEIARAIVDGRGLLVVHLNSIRHHHTKTAHARGLNPLAYMAIGKVQANVWDPVKYYLFEWIAVPDGFGDWKVGWHRYRDYTNAVDLPRWVDDPPVGRVTPLSRNALEYDYIADQGHKNIGSWIDRAAERAGR